METTIYIGIDVSKDKFDYAAVDTQTTLIKKGSLQMNRVGFQELEKLIKSFSNVVVGFKSTGTYRKTQRRANNFELRPPRFFPSAEVTGSATSIRVYQRLSTY